MPARCTSIGFYTPRDNWPSLNAGCGPVLRRWLSAWLILLAPSALSDNFWPPENYLGVVDLSSRHLAVDGNYGNVHHIGFDARYVVSGESGDIGTLLFQPFVQIADGAGNARDDFQWRMTNFNFTGLGHGRFNVRLGHFELPFGLEQVLDTNGTLEQVQNGVALGLKTDWGASLNGVLPKFEYEFAFMGGGGNALGSPANGLFVGRVGTSSDRRLWLGLSALDGEIEAPSGVQSRRRGGIDVGWRLPRGFSLLAEYAGGEDAGDDANFALGQLEWMNLREQLRLYLQFRFEEQAQFRRRNLTMGMKYEPNLNLILSAQLGVDISRSQGLGNREVFTTQFRYRF